MSAFEDEEKLYRWGPDQEDALKIERDSALIRERQQSLRSLADELAAQARRDRRFAAGWFPSSDLEDAAASLRQGAAYLGKLLGMSAQRLGR